MLEFISIFEELQQIDAERLMLEKQLASYPSQLAAQDQKLAAARKAFEALEEEKKSGALEQRKLEHEIRDLEEKSKRYEEQEMTISSQKQLEALQHEVAGMRARIAPLEDRELALMMRADELATAIPKARQRVDATQGEVTIERARIEELARIKKEALALNLRDHERFVARVEPALLKEYEHIFQKYPGKVTAAVKGESCGGCFTQLMPNLLMAVRKGEAPIRCPHCQRFIYAEKSSKE
ncbi:MAG: C4-type zinc ribbon domain-containing protein [Candidatus Sumerlaeota bacterium]|nr:C4-type zinc ribbon domain-containing protein [Candidatus Sumerlaeota bacterium]